jgi:hypothetical protein
VPVLRRAIGSEAFLDLPVSGEVRCRREEAAGRALAATGKIAVWPTGTKHDGKSLRTEPRVRRTRRIWQFFVVNVPSLFENNTDEWQALSGAQESLQSVCSRYHPPVRT